MSSDLPEKFQVNIKPDHLTHPEIHLLLQQHLQSMALHSPPKSIHALDIDALRQPCITFWTAWADDELPGCGAPKEIDGQHAEIKSMRTAHAHPGKGVANALLAHIIAQAKRRSYQRLSLETGSGAAFKPAHRLYAAFGFTLCGPFAGFAPGPLTVFRSREI